MTFFERLLPEYDKEMKSTRALLERVPDDKFTWKPHEKSMTLGRLAGHVAEMPNWATHTITLEGLDVSPGEKATLSVDLL